MNYSIKFRPIKPRSPHLNGKVERSHNTDLIEFYSLHSLDDPHLGDLLAERQHFYNWHRPHSSLGGKTPNEKCSEMSIAFSNKAIISFPAVGVDSAILHHLAFNYWH